MTTEERLAKIEEKLDEHDDKIIKLEKQQITDKFELSNLITDAVNKAIEPLIKKLEEQDKRITTLENAEAQKALKNSQELWKNVKTIIITAVVSFFATLMINNFVVMISNNANNQQNVEEVAG